MKDKSGQIEYKNKIYPIVFNLNVMEQIQEEYGTVDEWGALTDGTKTNGEPNAKAVKFGITAMINEGLDIESEENGTEYKPVSLKFVGRMIYELGLEKVAKEMKDTVIESTESAEKNA